MTTLVYRDGVLAADSLATCNGLRDGSTTKIHRVGQVLIGGAGPVAIFHKFHAWVKSGMPDANPYEGSEGNGLLVSKAGVICFGSEGCWRVTDPFYSLGSGYKVALGALSMGATAEQAVRIAMQWDVFSGGDVKVLRL